MNKDEKTKDKGLFNPLCYGVGEIFAIEAKIRRETYEVLQTS
jgi:hypothetical protein